MVSARRQFISGCGGIGTAGERKGRFYFRRQTGADLFAGNRIQEGAAVAHNIKRELGGEARKDFHYVDKGSLATIGRAAAIAQFGKIHISGYFAWLSWLFVHIFFLIGFRNRLLVMIQWAWSYFTYERGARLIIGASRLPGWTEPARTSANSSPETAAKRTA